MGHDRLAASAAAVVTAIVLGGCGVHGAASGAPSVPPSLGPTATIPNVVGKPLSQAIPILTADGFTPGVSGLSPTDVVTGTDPAPGTYSGGAAYVRIAATPPTTTTTAPPTVVVPNVAGDTIAAATSAMGTAGLQLSSTAVYPSNIVAYTEPAAGALAPVGSVIQQWSCAAGNVPAHLASGSWVCNPDDTSAIWGGR